MTPQEEGEPWSRRHPRTAQHAVRPEHRWRWRLFVSAEIGLIVALILVARILPEWLAVLLFVWLVFTFPICVLYLIGHPPVISLVPLVPSPLARAYRQELRSRPELDDESFFARFYGETDVPREIPIRLRKICMETLSRLLSRVHPDDFVTAIDYESDLGEILEEAERAFAVRFTSEEMRSLDGSFDSLVQLLKSKLAFSREDEERALGSSRDVRKIRISSVVFGAIVGAVVGFAYGSLVLDATPGWKLIGAIAGTLLGALLGELDRKRRR
jgi:hypothetical protein